MKKFFFVLLSILLGTIPFAFNASADDTDEVNSGKFRAASLGANSGLVQSNGALLMWGDNRLGQLGVKTWDEGGSDDKTTPEFILKKGVKFVALAGGFSAIIKDDDTLWMTGSNESGQLGDGTTTERHAFKRVEGINNVAYVAISTFSNSNSHTFAVTEDGTLYAWGDNTYGQLCNGTTNGSLTPKRVPDMNDVKRVYAGQLHTAIVKKDGTVWMCGYNWWGQLGLGHYSQNDRELTPQQIVFKDNNNKIIPIKEVSPIYRSTLFLLEDGTLWFAGDEMFGDACQGDDFWGNATPKKIATNVKLARHSDAYVTAYITNDNTLYMCGYNGNADLGLGYNCDGYCAENTPKRVMGDVADISVGSGHSLAKTLDGTLYCWGANGRGACGLGTDYGVILKPTQVKLPIAIPEGKTLEWNGKKQVGVEEGVGYSVKKNTGKEVGNYTAVLKLAKDYKWEDGSTKDKKVKWKIVKAQNPMTVVGKQASVKYKKVKDSDVFIARKNVFVLKKNKGALTFTKTKGNNKILVEKNAGTVKVSKGLKKGTYQIKVKVTAAGDEHYKLKSETVGVVIIIK